MTADPLASPEPIAVDKERGNEEPYHGRKRWLLLLLLLLLLLCTCCLWYYYFTTKKPVTQALPPAQVVAKAFKPHYLFSIYGLDEPVGVAVNPDGDRIYVAESTGERLVKVFDRDGNPLYAFAPPQSQVPLRAPVYIALDSAGQVYVSDRARHSIDVYDAGGNFKSSVVSPIGKDWSPMGIRFNGDYLLITDVTEKQHRIAELNKEGGLTRHFGREGKGNDKDEFWYPNSAVYDARGRLYVSDSNNSRVRVFDANDALLTTFGGFSLPRGMMIDGEQRLYVVDAVDHRVKVFDASQDPRLLFDFGDAGVGDGEFQYPNDIALDSTERLYIADRVNNRVQVWVY